MMFARLREMEKEAVEIRMIMRKVASVICSCRTFDQLEVAQRFMEVAVRRFESGYFAGIAIIPEVALRDILHRQRARIDASQKESGFMRLVSGAGKVSGEK